MGRPRKDKVVKPKKERVVKKKVETKQTKNENFFAKLAASTNNELAKAVSEGTTGDVDRYIDTGVYIFNGQLSGSLQNGGIPDNKIIVFAGPSATGKTFFILSIIKFFLNTYPDGGVMFFESESAIGKAMVTDRGIDPSRIYMIPVSTVQEWRYQTLQILAKYKEHPDRPMLLVLDSLGNLSTNKEMEDSESGSDKTDMTRARLIKAAFRTITLKLGVLGIPLLITNHTYDTQGMFSTKVQSGGSGVSYNNSISVFLGKSKEKDGDDVVGALIRSKLQKSRFTKENTQVEMKLYYDRGLDRYYGLLDLGLKYDIITKSKDKGYVIGGQVASEKVIYKNPEKYFTQEVMDQLEVAAKKEFSYGSALEVPNEVESIEVE